MIVILIKEQAEIEELKRQIVEESKVAKVKEEEMETKDVEEEARRRHEQKVRSIERWNTVIDCRCRRRQHGRSINEMEVDHPIPINHLDREEEQMEVSDIHSVKLMYILIR